MKTMRQVNRFRMISVAGMMIVVVAAMALSPVTSQGAVIYSENFDGEGTAADAYNNGTTPEINVGNIGALESSGVGQGGNAGDTAWSTAISSAKKTGSAGLRFGGHENWATSANSAAILSAGGFSVSFDFTGAAGNWLGVKVGNGGMDSAVNDADVDFAAVVQGDGQMQTFDNGSSQVFGTATVAAPRSAEFTYAFNSWNAGTTVSFTGIVDGSEVATDSFTWDGTDDVKIFFGAQASGNLVDNIVVSTIPEPASLGLIGLMGAILLIRRRLYGNRK